MRSASACLFGSVMSLSRVGCCSAQSERRDACLLLGPPGRKKAASATSDKGSCPKSLLDLHEFRGVPYCRERSFSFTTYGMNLEVYRSLLSALLPCSHRMLWGTGLPELRSTRVNGAGLLTPVLVEHSSNLRRYPFSLRPRSIEDYASSLENVFSLQEEICLWRGVN